MALLVNDDHISLLCYLRRFVNHYRVLRGDTDGDDWADHRHWIRTTPIFDRRIGEPEVEVVTEVVW